MYMPYLPYVRIERSKVLATVALGLVIFHQAVPQISLSEIAEHPRFAADEPSMAQLSDEFQSFSQHTLPPVTEHESTTITPSANDLAMEAELALMADQRAQTLDKLVQPITTVTEFVGGQQEKNRGSGFVVGNHFITVHHNLTTAFPSLRVKSTSFIDGMSVSTPIYANERADVAVFELPDKLCVKHCNQTEVAYAPDLSPGRSVYWLRKFEDDFILKEAAIIKQVAFGNTNQVASTCGDNAVMLVDAPFIPGSSGSPIMDAETGKIIGIIQGSVGENDDARGYFKPINCVLAMMQEPLPEHSSLAKL